MTVTVFPFVVISLIFGCCDFDLSDFGPGSIDIIALPDRDKGMAILYQRDCDYVRYFSGKKSAYLLNFFKIHRIFWQKFYIVNNVWL